VPFARLLRQTWVDASDYGGDGALVIGEDGDHPAGFDPALERGDECTGHHPLHLAINGVRGYQGDE
jgi:hypothetical protein